MNEEIIFHYGHSRSSDAGKKHKHVGEIHKEKSERNSYKNESERENELTKKKATKKRKAKEDLQTTQSNDFECVNGKKDVDGNVIRKKLKKQKKRQLDHEMEQSTADGKESCERKHKKARVDPPMASHYVEKKKKRKKKKKDKYKKSLSDISEVLALQITNHKLKSKTRKYRGKEKCHHVGTENILSCFEASILDSPGYTNPINDSSSLPSANKERRHKKKKNKEKERESNRTFSPRIETQENADKQQNSSEELKEAIKQANVIHGTWTPSKEQLGRLKDKGEPIIPF